MSRHAVSLLFAGLVVFSYGVFVRFGSWDTQPSEPMTSLQLRDAALGAALEKGQSDFSFTTDKPPLPVRLNGEN